MEKARIFISSTCYDLKAVREHLRESICGMGHDVLASEYNSFPVNPGVSTVENCKKVIRDFADAMILVIGGRKGCVDESGCRSIVNAEYIEAKAKGIDVFVFIDKQVMDLFPVYLKNKGMDLCGIVDSADVFSFISDIKVDNHWIYTFSKTEDIITTFKTQFSTYTRMLIEQRISGTLTIPREFRNRSPKIITLIQERPTYWEYMLVCYLLEECIEDGKYKIECIDEGILYNTSGYISDGEDARERILVMLADLKKLVGSINPIFNKIMTAWGAAGVSGDPLKIYRACDLFSHAVEGIVEWELRLRSLGYSDEYIPVFAPFSGQASKLLKIVGNLPSEIRSAINYSRENPDAKTYQINYNFKFDMPTEQVISTLRRLSVKK